MGERQSIFVVLGMPRSGTSVVMRGLNALGIEIGEKLVPPSDVWNPTGFWEDQEISQTINCGVLFALDYVWDSVSLIAPSLQKDEKLLSLKTKAIALLKERMRGHAAWGFKDPRTAKILLFWQSVFAEMQLQENYIIALRNPLAVAMSYQKLRKFDLETGLLLWLMHVVPSVEETHHQKRLVVSYEALLQSPEAELKRIQTFFSIPSSSAESIQQYTQSFLDRNLEHFGCSAETFQSHPALDVVPLCRTVYALLQAVALDQMRMTDAIFIESWQQIKNEFLKLYPLFLYIDELLKKNRRYERNLRSWQRSFLWKFITPLRLVDDWLRQARRQKREKRKLRKQYL